MLARVTTYAKWALIALISVTILLFAVNNHAVVDISLLPLPYEARGPLFLFIMVSFIAGVLTGGVLISAKALRWQRKFRREMHRANALQNELDALRARDAAPALPREAA